MSVLKNNGEKIISQFTEEEFISSIETSLNRVKYYDGKRIGINRISQAIENDFGYDGVLTTIVPFYIQFKRSNFYTPKFRGQLYKDRVNISYPVSQGFFAFELLRKNNEYKQHEKMYELSKKCKAAYVAPKFIKKSCLEELKFLNRLPITYLDIELYDMVDSLITRNQVSNFYNCITIKPHSLISDKNVSHHYSFCRDNKVGFHSEPIRIEEPMTSFNEFLEDVLNQEISDNLITDLYNYLPNLLEVEKHSFDYDEIIKKAINRVSSRSFDEVNEKTIAELEDVDKLLIIEDVLYNYFDIIQYVVYK